MARDFDAIILGYGPVGATAANMLLRRGWKIAIIDRMEDIYPLPRAALFDAEIMRVFQEIGVAEELDKNLWHGAGGAEFVTSKGETISRMDIPSDQTGRMGWFEHNFFHQPIFERALRDHAEASDRLSVFLEHEASAPQQKGGEVVLEVESLKSGKKETLSAPYLLGADGAASLVRKSIGASVKSLGYDRHWLVMDVLLKKPAPHLPPIPQQICDPKRQQTFIPMVDMRRRWEFRMNDGETEEELQSEAKAWELLKRWNIDKDNAEIERSAVYEFHAAIADKWREGGIFLLGDAAHQMPPFLGQGMCAGVRDVSNLCWKLDMVRHKVAPPSLLESYQEERYPHALDFVDFSVQVGKLIDRLAESERTGKDPGNMDAIYGGTRDVPHLHGGVLALGKDDPIDFVTGFPAPQPRIHHKGKEMLMDDVIGSRFAIVSEKDLSGSLSAAHRDFLKKIDAVLLPLPKDKRADDQMDFHLGQHEALIVRPDRYVFGVVNQENGLDAQMKKLQSYF